MQVIPVVDVRAGVAVAASRGDRTNYRPLSSPLAANADPVIVAEGLRTLFPFPILYVADLDGIEKRGADLATQERLCAAWQGSEVWIDDGSTGAGAALTCPASPLLDGEGSQTSRAGEGAANHVNAVIPSTPALPTRGRGPVVQHASLRVPPPLWGRTGGGEARDPQTENRKIDPMIKSHVLGSESLTSLDDYRYASAHGHDVSLLSLDFRGDEFIGPRALLADASLWPARVIVMTLARVGSGEGPDLARLASISERAGGREVYAAGGVRHADDLRALRDIGVTGALVATALHNGRIARRDLEAIA